VLTLALTTSSTQGSICLGRDEVILKNESWQKKTSHSETITLALQKVLSESRISLSQIKLIVCSQGPGSFTGLRVGLSVARSLSYCLQIPIIPLNDGLCIALNAKSNDERPRLIITDAQKNKVFSSIYQKQQERLNEILAPTLFSIEHLALHLNSDEYLLMGEGAHFMSSFPETIQKKFVLEKSLATTPQAEKMLIYAHQNFSSLQKISWHQLLPLYLRASAAEEIAAEKISKIK
jgi:tRNA threonylcarbamoyladenosine biosynthesis protein TsaB